MELHAMKKPAITNNSQQYSERELLSRWSIIAQKMWIRRNAKQKWLHCFVLYPALMAEIKRLGIHKVLDYGCAAGDFVLYCLKQQINDRSFFAYDRAEGMMQLASIQLPREILLLSGLGNRKFDGIVMNMVLQDIFDIEKVLVAMRKHLCHHGRLVLTLPNPLLTSTTIPDLTVRHEVFDDGHMDGIVKEKTYWTSDKSSWTIQFHRTQDQYLDAFLNSGFALEKSFFPKPIAKGRTNLDLYRFHSTTNDVVIFILRSAK